MYVRIGVLASCAPFSFILILTHFANDSPSIGCVIGRHHLRRRRQTTVSKYLGNGSHYLVGFGFFSPQNHYCDILLSLLQVLIV